MYNHKVEVELREDKDGAVLVEFTDNFESDHNMSEGELWDFFAEMYDETYPDAEWLRVKLISVEEIA